MISTIGSSDFQVLLSLWGQNRTTGDWSDLGYLEDNKRAFPLQASFQDLKFPAPSACAAVQCPSW